MAYVSSLVDKNDNVYVIATTGREVKKYAEKILEVYASIFEKRTIPDAQTRTDRVPVTARSL